MMTEKRQRLGLRGWAVLLTLSALVAVLAAEIYVRLFSSLGYFTPEIIKRKYSVQYEPSVITRYLLPEKEQHIFEFNADKPHLFINAKGYRGRDFPKDKPAGVVRIMIYGGSAVFDGNSVEDNDWPHQVERFLHDAGYRNIEVINAGIPGSTSLESLGRLMAEGHVYSPDFVLLYNTWNDIKYFRQDKPVLRIFRPHDPNADPRTNYQNFIDRLLSNVSQLYVRLRQNYYTWKFNVQDEEVSQYAKPSSEITDLGLRQYRLNLAMFADLARNIGAVPIFMKQARLAASNNSDADKKRVKNMLAGLTHQALVDAFDKADAIITEVARDKDVRIIDATTNLTGDSQFLYDHVHLTARGSKELARLTALSIAPLLPAKQ